MWEISLKDTGLWKKKHYFYPGINLPVIKTFISSVDNCINTLRREVYISILKHPSLLAEEVKAIDSLSRDVSLTIKPADKGKALVVMDTS